MKKIPLPRSSIVVKKNSKLVFICGKNKKTIAKHCKALQFKRKHGKAAQCARSVLYCFTAQYYTAVFKYIPLG